MSDNNPFIEKSVLWVKTHWQTLSAVIGTVAIGAAVFSLVLYRKHAVEEQGWNMLSYAENQIMQGQATQGITTLNQVVQQYHSAPMLAQAYQLLGSLSLVSGNAQQSITMYEEGIKNASSNPNNRSLLTMSLATAYEEGGDLQKADSVYDQFLIDFPEHFLTPRILMDAIRVEMLANNAGAAREHYERLLTSYPNTSWAKRAGVYLAEKGPTEKVKLP